MNVRIQQLSDQAKDMIPKNILAPDDWIKNYNLNLTKLIIDDCVNVMHEQEKLPTGFWYPKGVSQHELAIKQHFGVEE